MGTELATSSRDPHLVSLSSSGGPTVTGRRSLESAQSQWGQPSLPFSLLALRRVERQQHLIKLLHVSRRRITYQNRADALHGSEGTIARDVARLRESGVSIHVTPGSAGGVSLERSATVEPIPFDLLELAALISSLTALGPT